MNLTSRESVTEVRPIQITIDSLDQYETYEDYLQSQVTNTDMFYLENSHVACQLVELGYRGSGDILKRKEFEAKKRAHREKTAFKLNATKQLPGVVKSIESSPFLNEIAEREEQISSGKLVSVIYIRGLNSKGQEVSGYIDLAHRLETEKFESYFSLKKKFLPKATDLSYYNWKTQTSTSTSSPNIQVHADNESGLLFKCKRDRKVICVDPTRSPGDNTTRIEIRSEGYIQVVFFDHITRRTG